MDLGCGWGRSYGGVERVGWIPGGVGGGLSGAAFFGESLSEVLTGSLSCLSDVGDTGVLAALTIVGVRERLERELESTATIIILILSSILGMILGSRYRFIGLSSIASLAS